MRKRGPGRGISHAWNRIRRRGARVRADGAHDGLCHRAHLGLPLESGRHGGVDRRETIPGEIPHYVVAQVLGATAAAGVLYLIASGKTGFDLAGGFASNGYGEHSPGGYSLVSGLIAETVLTFMFLMIILGATDDRAPKGFAPIPIGFALTLIHLIGIPVTNVSVNPARSTGPALLVGGWAMEQLWAFWVAPIVGAALAGVVYPLMAKATK
jgi:aquaporin Z